MGKMKDLEIEGIEERSYSSVDELMARLNENDKKHPVRGWFDKIFPNGIAGWRAWYSLSHPWKIIEYCWQEMVFAWQRVFRGWDDRAVWSIDWYLAKLIPQLIRELSKQGHGLPGDLFPNDTFGEGATPEEEEEALRKWHEILEKIAIGFDVYHEHEHEVFYKDEFKKPFEEAFDLFRKWFGAFWD